MVHVVKGRQYTHRCQRLNCRDSVRPTRSRQGQVSMLHAITGDELDSTIHVASELQIGRGMIRAIYI